MKKISDWPQAGKHMITLLLAWGTFSIMFGLFGAFDVMEAAGHNIASVAMIGAVKNAGIMMVTGSLIGGVPIYLLIRDVNHKS